MSTDNKAVDNDMATKARYIWSKPEHARCTFADRHDRGERSCNNVSPVKGVNQDVSKGLSTSQHNMRLNDDAS